MLTEKDLQSRKLPELKELGSKLEIPKAKTMKKGELVDAIKVKLNITSEAQAPKEEAHQAKPEQAPKKGAAAEGGNQKEGRKERHQGDHPNRKGPKNDRNRNHHNNNRRRPKEFHFEGIIANEGVLEIMTSLVTRKIQISRRHG